MIIHILVWQFQVGSWNRLQRFVAFQTAAGAGQRHRFGPELLATARRLAVRPRQAGQHRSRSLRFRADTVPFWKGSGGSQWTAPQQISLRRGRARRAASAFPWHRGCGGCGAAGLAGSQSLRSEQGRPSLRPERHPGVPPARSSSSVMPSGAELLPRPPQGDASHRAREPRTPTSALRAQLLHWARTCGAGVARGAQQGWRLEPLHPAEMTWRLWLWCFCAWVAAGWPPGSALQLRPGM
ncbi:PREDICTED: uncharacterized protein LOC108636358 [Capra hircus]|uniref:uncharacterized protein LOC108636358 n=1 Tax=Capra hircus TaxID=9925 RepID=UPI0008471610|nr:PREDICTED: uncharacterized protein LOC108636358 [Capra hircus]